LERSALDWRQAVNMALAIAGGLAAAHAKGIIHRDLKPENIFLASDGRVRILDFNLAKIKPAIFGDDSSAAISNLTERGMLIGTLSYMSPEQAEGKEVDARSDVFEFCSVLYEMVTGQRSFEGESRTSTLSDILHKEPKPATAIVESVPQELEKIIARCLRKEIDSRFQTMADVLVELRKVQDEGQAGAKVQAVRGPSRGRIFVVAVLVTALAVASAAWWLLHPQSAHAPEAILTPV